MLPGGSLEGLDLNEVMAAPIVCVDGLHDRWDRTPAEFRHLWPASRAVGGGSARSGAWYKPVVETFS